MFNDTMLLDTGPHQDGLAPFAAGPGEAWCRRTMTAVERLRDLDLRGMLRHKRDGFHPTESWFWDVLSQGFCPGFFTPGIWGETPNGFQAKNVSEPRFQGTFRGPMGGYTVAAIAIFSLRTLFVVSNRDLGNQSIECAQSIRRVLGIATGPQYNNGAPTSHPQLARGPLWD